MGLLKRIIKQLLERAGIRISRINRRQILPPHIPDLSLYRGPEDSSRLFRPWSGPPYVEKLTPAVQSNTMLSPMKLYMLRELFRSTLPLEGAVFEAGCGSGGSSRLMLDLLLDRQLSKPMWLLDTFEGYQKIDASRDGSHSQISDCRGKGEEEVRALLQNTSIPVHLVKGLIPATLDQVAEKQFCFAHIDVNLHEPTKAATQFCLDRMVPGGIILFDDFNWPATYGAREAISSVAAEYEQTVISIPESTQAFLIKR